MKKIPLLLCLTLLLFGCASQKDPQVDSVREQIQALPTVEQFQALDARAQQEAYNDTQIAYDAYMALTEAQRQQISGAAEIFQALFAHFNSQVMPLPETETSVPTTEAETIPETAAPVVVALTEEEKELLLKIGMAELGNGDCVQCIALVMRTVLNRVESDRFAGSVRGVLYTPEQFTPVMDGSFENAEPNALCQEALDMVIHGWDESQGACFYEFCEGESWHSQNLQLLFQHCDTRFYQ